MTVDEVLDRYIGPDVLLPSQQPGRHQPPSENRLKLAVLRSALEDLNGGTCIPHASRRRQWRLDAIQWLEDTEQQSPFSFIEICDALKIDAASLKAALQGFMQRREKIPLARQSPRGHNFMRMTGGKRKT